MIALPMTAPAPNRSALCPPRRAGARDGGLEF